MPFTYDYMYWRLFCKSYLLKWFESSRAISYSKIIRGKHDKTKRLGEMRCKPAVHMLTLRNRARCGGWEDLSDQLNGPNGLVSASLRLRPDRISDTSGLYLLPCSDMFFSMLHQKHPCERRYRLFKTLFFKKKLKHLRDGGAFGIEVQNQGAPKLILILLIFTI